MLVRIISALIALEDRLVNFGMRRYEAKTAKAAKAFDSTLSAADAVEQQARNMRKRAREDFNRNLDDIGSKAQALALVSRVPVPVREFE